VISLANIHYIKVINRRRKFFTQYNAPRAVELADALVGAQTALQRQHGVLKSGMYAFVIVENQLYVAQGIHIGTLANPLLLIHCISNSIGDVLPERG
jgi:hypothetical protein